MTVQAPHTVTPSQECIAVVERESKTVHLYVPRRTLHTSDADLAANIEEMSRLRREWLDRGYHVELIN